MDWQPWVALAALVAALWPLSAWARRAGFRARSALLLLVAGAASAVAWAAFAWRPAPEPEPADRPIPLSHGGYATSQACASCHPREYATWHGSFHRTMTQPATPESVVAPFDGVTLEMQGVTYRLERRGDEFWVEQSLPRPGGARATLEREIVLVTGSHHFQAYWFATGRTRVVGLFQFAYQIGEQRWIPMDALALTPSDVHQSSLEGDGRWNKNCNRCHSTGPLPRVHGPDVMDTRVAEFGIACEACHGPAERHVRENRSPWRRYRLHVSGDADDTAVQPERLPHRRSSQVCGQCHSVNAFHDRADQRRWAELGPGFRPGDELTETRRIVHSDGDPDLFEATRFWSDGVVRVNGREYNSLLGNPCFAKGEMSCLSCHSLHQAADDPRSLEEWRDDQLQPGMRGNLACVQCHREYEAEDALVAHTHHEAESSGSECMNCHMPNTVYGLQKATRNHGIDMPSVAASVETGRPNACNACHLDRTLAWAARELEERYGIVPPELSREQRETAAGVLWTLTGEAGQRALMAWHMGWAPARAASGDAWMPPYLGQLLADPYAAVRSIAYRSLRSFEGYEDFEYDFDSKPQVGREAAHRVLRIFRESASPPQRADARALLLNEQGQLQTLRFGQLLRRRDDRWMVLAE